MKNTITMPALTPEMKSGVFCAWCKEPGEAVKRGEVLFEIETDKVVSQVEAEEDCILEQQLVEEGDEIEVGTPVAVTETESDTAES